MEKKDLTDVSLPVF